MDRGTLHPGHPLLWPPCPQARSQAGRGTPAPLTPSKGRALSSAARGASPLPSATPRAGGRAPLCGDSPAEPLPHQGRVCLPLSAPHTTAARDGCPQPNSPSPHARRVPVPLNLDCHHLPPPPEALAQVRGNKPDREQTQPASEQGRGRGATFSLWAQGRALGTRRAVTPGLPG